MKVIKEPQRVYLDYNATTPPALFLEQKISEWIRIWGNPSSVHQTSQKTKTMISEARKNMAQFIGSHPLEIIFTSGGSESNNYALKGLVEKFENTSQKKILTSSVEHSSVYETLQWAQKKGFTVEMIPVSKNGEFDLKKFEKSLDDQVAFVTVMYANNETGHIFPIQEIRKLAHQKNCLVMSDAVQTLGKIPINVKELGVDILTFSGHKFYSLKGCGFVYCRKGLALESLVHGGSQERKRRAGTENTLSILALGAVAQRGEEILNESKKITQFRDEMEEEIVKKIKNVQIIGKTSPRLGNTSSIWIREVFAETVLINLDLKGYSLSVSSACHSGSISPSRILMGMGYTPQEAQCVLRVSLGLGIDQKSLHKFVSDLKHIIERIRKIKSKD